MSIKKGSSTVGANRLEMHCEHERVFESDNRVRRKPEEIETERGRGGDVRGRITFMGL